MTELKYALESNIQVEVKELINGEIQVSWNGNHAEIITKSEAVELGLLIPNMQELAEKFAWAQYEFTKIKIPSIKEFKGETSYCDFCVEFDEYTKQLRDIEKVYILGAEKYGKSFVAAVDVIRLEIGKQKFGFNN